MLRFVFLLCLLAPSLATEAECFGEDGELEGADRNRMDRWLSWIIKNKDRRTLSGLVIRRIISAARNPKSLLRRYLGAFGQDPRYVEAGEERPFFNVDARWVKILNIAHGEGIRTVITFLWRYGYLPKILQLSKRSAEEFSGSISPCALTNAVMEFQRFHQITPINGVLTKETLELMAKDRCGNADVKCETDECIAEDEADEEEEDDGHLKRKKRYSVKTKLWKSSEFDGQIHLNFWYENMYDPNDEGKAGHDQMTESQVRFALERGLATWTKHTGLHLNEVDNKRDADIRIFFGQGAHNEKRSSSYFDGPLGVLAHMYYPRSGKMHFDQAENFTASHEGPGINLEIVAAHEMGHGLGIEHSKVRGALMYPYYSGYKEDALAEDDISAIQSIYGSETGSLTSFSKQPTAEDEI